MYLLGAFIVFAENCRIETQVNEQRQLFSFGFFCFVSGNNTKDGWDEETQDKGIRFYFQQMLSEKRTNKILRCPNYCLL
jgi:hypothetical protein